MDGSVHVSMAINQGYEIPLAVALTSLAIAQPAGTCEVTILHQRVAKSDQRRIEDGIADRLKLNWIDVDVRVLKGARYPAFLTSATLFRLMLPDLLPDLERTLYLDSDLVVLRPITELYQWDIGNGLVGAVREASSPWAAGPTGTYWRDLGLAPETPYFNGGVLLIPLSVWRTEGVATAALEILRTKKTRFADQCAMNAVANGHWVELPRHWNVQTADWNGQALGWALWQESVAAATADPRIIHYNERDKPWHKDSRHPKKDLWLEFLDQSPWAGWRPGKRQRAHWREAASRAKAANRLLWKGV
jgi:lipopolysaccharide biosynthesis glycosyltransferase